VCPSLFKGIPSGIPRQQKEFPNQEFLFAGALRLLSRRKRRYFHSFYVHCEEFDVMLSRKSNGMTVRQ
jgi:hypothetical protein